MEENLGTRVGGSEDTRLLLSTLLGIVASLPVFPCQSAVIQVDIDRVIGGWNTCGSHRRSCVSTGSSKVAVD